MTQRRTTKAVMPSCALLLLVGSFHAMGVSSAPLRREISLPSEIKAGSVLGSQILSQARRLANDDQNQYFADLSFVANYNIKFQGCHHLSQWNENADDADEVRVQTKRLVRFRLCPADDCTDENSKGCSSEYGDYVVDMETFVYSYAQEVSRARQYDCQQYNELCANACYADDNADEGNSCMYGCLSKKGKTACYQLKYNQDAYVDPLDYAQCAQYNFQYAAIEIDDAAYVEDDGAGDDAVADDAVADDAAAGDDAAQGDDAVADDAAAGDDASDARRLDEEYEYYIGPYCADQGGEIRFALFADNTCTNFVEGGNELFETNEGYEIPFSSESFLNYDCHSCEYQSYGDDDGGYAVSPFCKSVYATSGKCETHMGSLDNRNEAACTYIEGVKIVRQDGTFSRYSRVSGVATMVAGIFTALAVLLAVYVFYLRNKLGRAKIDLASQG